MSNEIDIWIEQAPVKIEDREKIIADTIDQVKKDFSLQGVELNLDELVQKDLIVSFSQLLEELEFLHSLKLPALLYQLDLNESKISYKLTSANPNSAYQVLAESILKRCFEKVMWRKKFQSAE